MRVLITGANGFLGSHLVDIFTTHGYEVLAGVRKNASLEKLNIEHCTIVQLNYQDIDSLTATFNEIKSQGQLDLVVHNAAITVAKHRETFFKVNTTLSKHVIDALKQSELLSATGKFAYISSLAAKGPLGKNMPVSAYGESKLATEKIIQSSGLPYLIYRPTGIYGPKDKDFVALFDSCNKGIYPLIGKASQKISMIHVQDVARAVFEISAKHSNEIAHLTDGKIYTNIDIKKAIDQALGKKSFTLKLPKGLALFFVRIASFLSKNPFMTVEKLKEITDDWGYDVSEERKKMPFTIKYDLYTGIQHTLDHIKSSH